ncbi:MAG: polysaccharide biosynthesis tyrosine autokinase [Planctomycetota bacterium]
MQTVESSRVAERSNASVSATGVSNGSPVGGTRNGSPAGLARNGMPVGGGVNGSPMSVLGVEVPQHINILSAIWRYKWAALIPAILGLVIGLIVFTQLPETYRSTTRLIIQNDRPAVVDQVTGDVIGGVPPIEVVNAQVTSDEVLRQAFKSPKLEGFRSLFDDDMAKFASASIKALELEPEVEDVRSAQQLVLLMHYEHINDELCPKAVAAFSDALQDYYIEQVRGSRSSIMELLNNAVDKRLAELKDLEQRYVAFRRQSKLTWDVEQRAINPHREQQLSLLAQQSEVRQQQERLQEELAMVAAITKEKLIDPIFTLKTIGQLLEKKLAIPLEDVDRSRLGEGDSELAWIQLRKELVPLQIEKVKLEAELGENHSRVQDIAKQYEMLSEELGKLTEAESERIRILREERRSAGDLSGKAAEAVKAVIYAMQAENDLLSKRIESLDDSIVREKNLAAQIADQENQDLVFRSEIDRLRTLTDTLLAQIGNLTVNEDKGGIVARTLVKPSDAYKVGPRGVVCLGIGSLLGLALGCGIALILEANANTFRNPDDVGILLGAPVLTHLPYFKGKSSKKLRKSDYRFGHLDPHLAVVHSPTSVPAEAVRSCRTSVFFELGSGGGKILQLTSPLPGDGKSTISQNLAAAIAQSGKSVLVIDCDLRKPRLGENFSVADRIGLTNVLNGECDPQDAIHESGVERLSVMPSGPIPVNPAEALSLPEMPELLSVLREQYDFIILDTPPLLVVTDASIVAGYADGVILALRIRRKSKPNAKEAMSILRGVQANVVGVIVNNSDEASSSDGYAGRGYYRYGKYTDHYRRSSKLDKVAEPFLVGGQSANGSPKPSRISGPSVAAASGSPKSGSPKSGSPKSGSPKSGSPRPAATKSKPTPPPVSVHDDGQASSAHGPPQTDSEQLKT